MTDGDGVGEGLAVVLAVIEGLDDRDAATLGVADGDAEALGVRDCEAVRDSMGGGVGATKIDTALKTTALLANTAFRVELEML